VVLEAGSGELRAEVVGDVGGGVAGRVAEAEGGGVVGGAVEGGGFAWGGEEEGRRFVVGPEFGTRCSTVITIDAQGEACLVERSFDPAGNETGRVSFSFNL
jgi:hypothetical protein